jgi:hypothetical protein
MKKYIFFTGNEDLTTILIEREAEKELLKFVLFLMAKPMFGLYQMKR